MTNPTDAPEVAGRAPKPTKRQRQAEAERIMCASWRDAGGPIRIMGYVEGYFMVRRPGAAPFCVLLSDFGKRYQIDDSAGHAALAAMEEKR